MIWAIIYFAALVGVFAFFERSIGEHKFTVRYIPHPSNRTEPSGAARVEFCAVPPLFSVHEIGII